MSAEIAHKPTDDDARLETIRRYDILDTPPDGTYDTITRLAAREFDVPIAIVSVVDEDRIWFKSRHGLPTVEQIGRDPGLCASAILQDDAWLIEDAAADPRALANPLVAGDFGLRFYLGIPLKLREGHKLGTLCVIDREPRRVTQDQVGVLEQLAKIVMDELELRLASIELIEAERRRADELRASAYRLNDQVVQQLTLAKGLREQGDEDGAQRALETALAHAQELVGEMVPGAAPGDLRH